MTRWFIGIGSNIDPRANVPRILDALADLVSEVVVSPIVETRPVAMDSQSDFLNLVVCVPWNDGADALKAVCVAIEASLGRDRDHEESKYRDRTADLDLLFCLENSAEFSPDLLPTESYVRPQAEALCGVLKLMPMPAEPIEGIVMDMPERPIGPKTDCIARGATLERTGS